MASIDNLATGRRKRSVARVILVPGSGKITVMINPLRSISREKL